MSSAKKEKVRDRQYFRQYLRVDVDLALPRASFQASFHNEQLGNHKVIPVLHFAEYEIAWARFNAKITWTQTSFDH